MAEPISADPMTYLRVDPTKAMKEQAKGFDAKKWVWVPVDGHDGYAAAQVKGAAGDKVTVETEAGKVRIKFFSEIYILCTRGFTVKPSGPKIHSYRLFFRRFCPLGS